MMKLLATLLMAVGLAALARADEEYYSASGPQYYRPQQQYSSSYSDYHQQPQPYYGHSFLDRIFGGNRRQDGILGGGVAPFVVLAVLVALGAGLLLAAAAASTSSGRGLDRDEWEVDHSIWMDQLQKDFEDSWSTQ